MTIKSEKWIPGGGAPAERQTRPTPLQPNKFEWFEAGCQPLAKQSAK